MSREFFPDDFPDRHPRSILGHSLRENAESAEGLSSWIGMNSPGRRISAPSRTEEFIRDSSMISTTISSGLAGSLPPEGCCTSLDRLCRIGSLHPGPSLLLPCGVRRQDHEPYQHFPPTQLVAHLSLGTETSGSSAPRGCWSGRVGSPGFSRTPSAGRTCPRQFVPAPRPVQASFGRSGMDEVIWPRASLEATCLIAARPGDQCSN